MSEQTTDDTRTEDEKALDAAKVATTALKEIASGDLYPSADRVAAASELLQHYRHFYV